VITVYVVGIVAAAVVVLTVAFLFRERLTEGSVRVGHLFTGRLRAAHPKPGRETRPPGGARIFERMTMMWSAIRVSAGSLVRMSRIFMLGSTIDVRPPPGPPPGDTPPK